jgi:hypothetical protein
VHYVKAYATREPKPMKKFTVYCQMACLEDIYAQMSQPMTEFLADSSLATWANLYQLLHEHSVLYLDVTPEELLELRKNPIINKLFKNQQLRLAKDDIQAIGTTDEVITKTSPQTLFFLDKSPAECKALEEDFGQIFISRTELATQSAWLFAWALRNIPKKDSAYTNWDFLAEFRHPCCALVLADNYILKKKEAWGENLLQVLDKLLPQKLNKREFEITIITEKKDLDNSLLKTRFGELSTALATLRPYTIVLSVVCTHEIHDRNLLTNYLWVSSGVGFTLFKNQHVTESTHLTMLPISYLHFNYPCYNTNTQNISYQAISSVFSSTNSLLAHYQEINRKASNTDNPPILLLNYQGSKQNRLLQ